MTASVLPRPSCPAQGCWQEPLDFELPDMLAATEPPEARGLARDAVRLMVSRGSDNMITHVRFRDLPDFLAAGDVLVVNTSATINASLAAWRVRPGARYGERIALHLSSPLPDGRWIVELRRISAAGSEPLLDASAGESLIVAAGGRARLIEPFRPGPRVRLWTAKLSFPSGVLAFAARYGSPIRYNYVPQQWPLEYYQTVFAAEPGSAEMPSAGRAFTSELVERLKRKGVRIAPVTLHTGVASLESDETPFPERYRVSAETAGAVNWARAAGGRVIAVGTTAVRALETVASADGRVHQGAGWTEHVVTAEGGVRTVDAILTGFHAPRASHLAMLEALGGRRHLEVAYRAALRHKYLWHEFGDLHLLLRL